MYWTHLTFALIHGLLLSRSEIAASKPGYLDFDNLPETNFSCDGKVIGGYYADVETGCQMFHVCTIGQKGEVTDIKFLCLNGTVFDQETRVCERIDEVDCAKSESFFGLNLELYNNHANFGGIQPEGEFECGEECSETEDYEEPTTAPSSTTTTPSSTTAAPSSTPPAPSVSSSTPAPSQRETLQALLALHSALTKPAPPRLINNAFSPRPTEYKPRDSHGYGSLNLHRGERPYYFTPSTEKSNYHHFHSGDTSFGHSLDATRPYNFQYFHSRKLPEEKPSVSVVTSTSTSTSVKTSKANATDFPTGYEDYQDDVQDHAFFQDVPKLRQKREGKHPNHRYEDDPEITTPRHKNHKYEDETGNEREEFLQNLLGSIDLDEKVREKMTDFFKKEDKEMGKFEKEGNSLSDMGNTIGQVFTEGMDILKTNSQKSKADKLSEWTKHFDDMKKDINLNYTFEVNFTTSSKRDKRDTLKTTRSTIAPFLSEERIQPRRTNIDTEKFHVETRRRKKGPELKPVSESIEDDLTTVEYRSSKRARSQPRSTTSLRAWTFNYEATTALPSSQDSPTSAEILDIIHEEVEQRPGRKPATRLGAERRPVARLGGERKQVNREQGVEGRPATRPGVERRPATREHGVERRPVARERGVERRPVPEQVVTREHGVGRRPVSRERGVERGPVPEHGVTREHGVERRPVAREHGVERGPLPEQGVTREHGVDRRPVTREQGVERGSVPVLAVEKRPVAEVQGVESGPVTQEEGLESYTLPEEEVERRPGAREPGVEAGRSRAGEGDRKEGRRVARVRQRRPSTSHKELVVTTTTEPPRVTTLEPDPGFSCEGKVKGGFYADTYNDCRAFFICSQGEINGPLLKSHFACGSKTKFNQRSRTCQAEDLVECEISKRYFHLNNDFLVPASEDELRGGFEPMKEG